VFILDDVEDIISGRIIMSRTATTVRLSGVLSDFVAAKVSDTGSYENVREYVRDLIRCGKERVEQDAFERLMAELARSFAAPEASYQPLRAPKS
jgi:Arc/MetJ-type ribon-helix-helix transcriptional regulator